MKKYIHNRKFNGKLVFSGFEVTDYPDFESRQGHHTTEDRKGKKFIVFHCQGDKDMFQLLHSESIVKGIRGKRGKKMMAEDGVSKEWIDGLGEYAPWWDEFVEAHGVSRYLIVDK